MKRILQLFASNYEENGTNIHIIAGQESFEEVYGILHIPQFLINPKSLKIKGMSFRAMRQDTNLSEAVLSGLFAVIAG